MRNIFLSRLDGEVPGVYPRAEVVERRRALYKQNLGAEGPWLQLVKDSSVLGSKVFLAPLGKNPTEHQ